jgi:hypothetical protein
MSYLCYLCIGVSNTCCVVFLLCLSSSCVPYVASFFGLSFFDCPFGILNVYILYFTDDRSIFFFLNTLASTYRPHRPIQG